MLPLHLFKKPAFTGVQLAALAVSASMFALFLYLTLYLQGYLGHDPLEAGLRYLPITVSNFFVAAGTGALLSRVQARVLISARPRHHGPGPAPHGRDRRRPTTGPGCSPASSSPAPASASSTRRSPTWPSRWCPRSTAAWPRGSTTRSARSESRSASRPGGRSSSAAAPPTSSRSRPARRRRPATARVELVEAVSSGNLDSALANVPPGARAGVADAAAQGFLVGDQRDPHARRHHRDRRRGRSPLWLIREDEIEREAPIEVEPRLRAGAGEVVLEPIAA